MPEFKKDRSKFKMKSWDNFANSKGESAFKFGLGKFMRKAAGKIGGAVTGMMGGGSGDAGNQAMTQARDAAMSNTMGQVKPGMGGMGSMAARKAAMMAGQGMDSAMVKKSKNKNK